MSLFAYKSITLSTLGTTCTLLTTCAARQYLLGVNACFFLKRYFTIANSVVTFLSFIFILHFIASLGFPGRI